MFSVPRLAAIILTKNEEKNIVDCIKSVSFADEILVIDSGSTDRTGELAKANGAKFVEHPMDADGFAGQRNFALSQTNADWVFYIDADERLIPACVPAIQQIVAENLPLLYAVERKNILFGKEMHYGGHRPDYPTRLCPRKELHWEGNVHEGIKSSLLGKRLKNCLRHYTYWTWHQYFQKFNQYTSLAAQSLYAQHRTISNAAMIGHAVFAFVRSFILQKGFLDGFLGLIMSVMAGFYVLVKYLKLKRLSDNKGAC